MKITKTQLKRLIKEELEKVLHEKSSGGIREAFGFGEKEGWEEIYKRRYKWAVNRAVPDFKRQALAGTFRDLEKMKKRELTPEEKKEMEDVVLKVKKLSEEIYALESLDEVKPIWTAPPSSGYFVTDKSKPYVDPPGDTGDTDAAAAHRTNIVQILEDAGMSPMDALVYLAENGIIEPVVDLGRLLKQ
jgi:hypothetical protein